MMTQRTRPDLGTYDDIAAAACRSTGLSDFGGSDHEEGLRLLCDDLTEHGGLTPVGNYLQRAQIKSALVSRLVAEQGFKDNPAYVDVPIKRPIFVTGLPRTGTTALHRLLTADPTHQGLELWLTEVPMPRPPRETWSENPIFQHLQGAYADHHVSNPEFMGIHFMDAASVEECWRVLRQSGRSIGFESLAHVPDYSAWLAQTDWLPAYERHRKVLQLVGMNDMHRRWVLKNPSHLVALDALMTVYPDALVVQTHRDPVTSIASACSLSAEATRGWSTVFEGEVVGRTQLEMLSRSARTFAHARRAYDPAQFFDVEYDDFVADPVAMTRSIYEAFALEWSEDVEAAVRDIDAESRQGAKKPSHRYQLADYGLTEEEVRGLFEGL